MNLGAELFRAWREREGLTQVQAAAELETDPWYLAKIERGARVPGRRLAVKIEERTRRKVSVASWDEPAARKAG